MRSETIKPGSSNGLKIVVLVSSYHEEVTESLSSGAQDTFIELGGKKEDCKIINTSGAWELPVLAKVIANENKCNAIVALGCIITGETTHDRVIGDAIANGLMRVAVDWGHPVSMGVLTCQNLDQAKQRAGGVCGNKGSEAMKAAITTAVELKRRSGQ